MRVIKPSFKIQTHIKQAKVLRAIESAGRTAYQSESSETSAESFVRTIIKSGHLSVLEHQSITVRIICDRGVSHEIVRHRIASYTQESTRYCNYAKDKFGNELTFIEPCFFEGAHTHKKGLWEAAMQYAEDIYLQMLELGCTPQEARSVLPNSLKTEIVMTMNLREWRHFFELRTAKEAHPQMREIAVPLLESFQELLPVIFGDL